MHEYYSRKSLPNFRCIILRIWLYGGTVPPNNLLYLFVIFICYIYLLYLFVIYLLYISYIFVIDYTKERKKFYSNLNLKNITDNKKFWKNIKPFFSNKGISKTEITLIEGANIISNDLEVANTLNSFFEHAVTLLGIPQVNDYLIDHKYILDPIEAIIRKYSSHPSVLNINIAISKSTFNFKLQFRRYSK